MKGLPRCPIAAPGRRWSTCWAGKWTWSVLVRHRGRAPGQGRQDARSTLVVGRTRFAGLPGLKTMGELGYKKLDFDFWHMLLAPAGTPRPIVDKLNAALRAALADARVRQDLCRRRHGYVPARRGNPRGGGRAAQARDPPSGAR